MRLFRGFHRSSLLLCKKAEILQHVEAVRSQRIKDASNYMEGQTCYISTRDWLRDDVHDAIQELHKAYFVMNCHTFKVMRLEPLASQSETRQQFPVSWTPVDPPKHH